MQKTTRSHHDTETHPQHPEHSPSTGRRETDGRETDEGLGDGLTARDRDRLSGLAFRVREHIIRMSGRGGCFIGASLSCADILVYLYDAILRVSPTRLDDPERDFLLLSKGHDVPALYGTLAELGYLERTRLENHLSPDDDIYWHPSRAIPGIEFHSGSLGHLLSVGVGLALNARIDGTANRIFVVLGDGELNEGSVWEAAQVAHAHKLDSLIAVVDRNGFQANCATESLSPLEPLEAKFEAFGWSVHRSSGHDFDALARAFSRLPREAGKPTAIVCDTVRGKGLPSIEARADRWFVNFTEAEVKMLLEELRGTAAASLTSAPLHVR
ncbi:MAG: transketolase [Deltaproteobacteria bacterium]|nr:transketolase [Deltaproteobacteria bacterium]